MQAKLDIRKQINNKSDITHTHCPVYLTVFTHTYK